MAFGLRRSIGISLLVAAGISGPASSAEAENKCVLALVATVPFGFTGPSLVPTFDGGLNGIPAKGHFDLTSSNTHLNRSALEKMGIKSGNSFAKDKVYGVGGSAKVYTAYVNEISVGAAKDSGYFDVIDHDDQSVGIIVGTDVLLRRDLEISFAGRYLKFFQPVNCRGHHLAYWDANAVAIPFWTYADDDARPLIKVKVNGIVLEGMLSSTVASCIISTSAAKKFGITPDSPGVVSHGQWRGLSRKLQPQWKVPLASVEVGDEKILNSTMVMHDLDGVTDIILGRDFLEAHRILISSSQQKIYLSYTGGAVFANTDFTKKQWFKIELEAGNPDAQYWMASKEENRSAALQWFEKAAANGHAGALMEVGRESSGKGIFPGA